MLKVSNKKITKKLAKQTYQANKKRNLLTVVAIILTTFLITVIVTAGMNYWKTISMRNTVMNGTDYDIALSEPNEQQIEKVRGMKQVASSGIQVKCAVAAKSGTVDIGKMRLYWAEPECWKKMCLPAFEVMKGGYPQKENEIVLSEDALKKMGIQKPQIGMAIPLTYYNLVIGGAEGQTEDQEELITKEFSLCGYFRDYTGGKRGFVSEEFYKTTGASPQLLTQGYLYMKMAKPIYMSHDIKEIQNELDLSERQYLDADYEAGSRFIKTALGISCLLLLIFVSGYLFIYHTFYISVSKDIRYYGQLKTIGMTSGQLRGVIYRQAFWNSCIGIPLGLLAAGAVCQVVLPAVLKTLSPEGTVPVGGKGYVAICFAAAAFAGITVFVSSRKPAVMAGECSLIEAVRFNGKVGKKRKKAKVKESNNGIRAMARRNIFRDKKQAAVIFLSFIVALSLFITVNVVAEEFDGARILDEMDTKDIRILNDTTLDADVPIFTEEKISKLRQTKGVARVSPVTSSEIIVPYQEDILGAFYRDLYDSRYTPGGDYKEAVEMYKDDPQAAGTFFTAALVGIDKGCFDELNESMDGILKWSDFKSGKTAIMDNNFGLVKEENVINRNYSFSTIDKTRSYTVKVAGLTEKAPNYFARGGYTPVIMVSEAFAKEVLGTTFTEVVDVTYEESYSHETEKRVKGVFEGTENVSYESKLERYESMKNTERQVRGMGVSIGAIIALLAIMNYMNMMAAGIENRAREFAALESLGMTQKQIRKMLVTEGLGYALISSVISLAIGIPISMIVFEVLNMYSISYSFPVMSNVVLFLVIFLISGSAPPFLYAVTQKGSVMERLKL